MDGESGRKGVSQKGIRGRDWKTGSKGRVGKKMLDLNWAKERDEWGGRRGKSSQSRHWRIHRIKSPCVIGKFVHVVVHC